ncbi:MAG: hypothetical protein QOI31_2543 [Solirubrobacterales bacterium]|jgi:hypothetical protein|nr:hypothetical protein [Solirubrobacterales bacterium]
MNPSRTSLLAVLAGSLIAVAPASADHDTYGTAEYGYGAGLLSVFDTPLAIPGSQGTAPLDARAGAEEDLTSPGFRKLDQDPVVVRKGKIAEGSDLAFRGRLMISGSYDGTGIFKRGRRSLEQISFLRCPAAQGDVTVSGDYVFVSIDSPSSNKRESATCNSTPTDVSNSSLNKEGLRIVDISNPRKPTQAGFIETECGSHTQTLVPGTKRSYIYVQSYPLTDAGTCTELIHPEGEISIISFPTDDPSKARNEGVTDIIPDLAVTPDTVGCHDAGVLPSKDLAAFACLGAFVIADISDPAAPEFLSAVQNPAIELDHSAQLTWDGKMAVIGDEHAGAAGGGGCSSSSASPVGAMWFYDISDPESPTLEGSYSLPRVPPVDSPEEAERFRCTTHNYSILPMKQSDRYVAVSPYYSGGLSIVDFSDPAAPEEKGFYLQQTEGVNPDIWSGYWFRGKIFTNENSSGYGVGLFKAKGFGQRKVKRLGKTFNPQTQVLP